jgi:hypothetical protein
MLITMTSGHPWRTRTYPGRTTDFSELSDAAQSVTLSADGNCSRVACPVFWSMLLT